MIAFRSAATARSGVIRSAIEYPTSRFDHTSFTAHKYSFPSDARVIAVVATPTEVAMTEVLRPSTFECWTGVERFGQLQQKLACCQARLMDG